jgi:hypothetical protein
MGAKVGGALPTASVSYALLNKWSLQARLFPFLSMAPVIGPTARVERGPSEDARSARKEPTRVSYFPCFSIPS